MACGHGAAAHGQGAVAVGGNHGAPMSFQTYEVPDVPRGVHFECPLLRGTMTKAVEFFHLFFTDEMINEICRHTDNYAYEHIIEGSYSSYTEADGSWKDVAVTPDEINRLIALLYFGLVKVGTNVDKYWSTKGLFSGLWARSTMSRLRLKAIMALLHVVDPTTQIPGDKLHEVDSFFNYFKSRSGTNPWGINLWVLADSSNGYTVDFNVYIGRAIGRDMSEHGLGYDVVVKLMQPYFNQGYHLFIDDFCTSTVLVKYLIQQGVPPQGEQQRISKT